jgi:hypothetical protein
MWNLNLPAFPHAILAPMGTTTDMAMDMATGKGEVNLKADGGKYFHLRENLLKYRCAEVLRCCSSAVFLIATQQYRSTA